VPIARGPGLLFLVVTLLVARLISFLVIVFLKVPLPGVILVMGFVILAVPHAYVIVFVFRVILGRSLLL